jgi:hypothetical protein
MNRDVFDQLLTGLDIRPVLMDVGASGTPPKIWTKIARHSIYVGFDPDLRDLHVISDGRFYQSIIVNKAVTTDKQSNEILFYFTKSPYCSSTLEPNLDSLSNFIFSDLFIVEKEAKVQATSLDATIDSLSLPCIDWLKTDSQGTDLRIFNSLRGEIRSQVLAIDIEPGLIDAYIGEDLFVDAHRELTQSGFWLSDLKVHNVVKLRNSTLREMITSNQGINYNFVAQNAKKSPGWCEARYFRTIKWLAQGDFDRRDYILLWIFALLDNQLGFAIDLGIEYERVFGKDDTSQIMREEPILRLKQSRHKMRFATGKSLPARVLQRLQKFWYTKLFG